MKAIDLYPCAQSTLTDLGHCAYESRHCPQCAGAYAVCTVCPRLGEVCPGCRHRAVLAQIAAGAVVYSDLAGDHGERHDPTAVGGERVDLAEGEAGELVDVDAALGAPDVDHGSDQAVTLDAGGMAVYSARVERPNSPDSPALGAPLVDTPASPLLLLLLPVHLEGLSSVMQALTPVLAGTGATNGTHNGPRAAVSPETPDRLLVPRHLAKKCYLSDTQCPSEHTYQDTGKVLRFRGNNQCVPCSGQRKPRRTAASTEG